MMFLANWTRQGDQLTPTLTMRRYPVPKWEARMKQKEHMEKSDKSGSQTSDGSTPGKQRATEDISWKRKLF